MRDPGKVGEAYLRFRTAGMWIEHAVHVPVDPYADGGHISADPKDHHSKVDQTLQHQEPSDGQ